MPANATVAVEGLTQFQRGLRKIDKDLPKGLRIALNECSDFLIAKTLPLIPRRSGAASRSLKARSSQRAVRIAVGGRRAPHYPWLDFGGKVGKNDSVARPFYKEGRYLYPTLRDNREQFQKILERAVVGIAERAGLDVD